MFNFVNRDRCFWTDLFKKQLHADLKCVHMSAVGNPVIGVSNEYLINGWDAQCTGNLHSEASYQDPAELYILRHVGKAHIFGPSLTYAVYCLVGI